MVVVNIAELVELVKLKVELVIDAELVELVELKVELVTDAELEGAALDWDWLVPVGAQGGRVENDVATGLPCLLYPWKQMTVGLASAAHVGTLVVG